MPIATANLAVIGVPFHIASHKEIEMAIVVTVEDVEKAVVVVIEESRAARHGFDQVFLRRRRILKNDLDPAQRLDFENRRCGCQRRDAQKITPRILTKHSYVTLLEF